MVEYSKVNVTLTDTQLKKLKTAVKNKTETILRISLKMFDENDLPHELLLTARQIQLRNAFNNNMSINIKLSKAEMSKIIQSGGFLGSLLNKLAAASAIDTEIQNKIHGLEKTTLIISNEEMIEIIKTIQALEDSNILLKRVTKTIRNETNETKRRIFKHVIR